jgi:hypothetical protein
MSGKVNHKGMRRGAMKNVEDVGSGSSADGPALRISRCDAISDVVATGNWRTELAFNLKRRHRGRKGVRAALIAGSIYHLGRAGSALCEVAQTSSLRTIREASIPQTLCELSLASNEFSVAATTCIDGLRGRHYCYPRPTRRLPLPFPLSARPVLSVTRATAHSHKLPSSRQIL